MARIALTGASGLIGSALARALQADGVAVVRVGRALGSDVQWDAARDNIDLDALGAVDAIVHLAGAPIAQRWTAARMREIRESRIHSTAVLARAAAAMTPRPRAFLCASAIGYYGDRGDELLTETSEPGTGFLADVVREWEAATHPAADAGVRVVHMRTGIVLSRDGGALQKMLLPFQLGLGGPVGPGGQWMSWITLHDLVRALQCVLASTVSGPVNMVTANPVTNADFARALGSALGRPAVIPVPAFALRAAFGEMAQQTILASQRVVPERLRALGFAPDTPDITSALRAVLSARSTR